MNKTAFITGATSGIGKATAKLFAYHGIAVVLCGRRQANLDALAKKLSAHTKVHTLNFDVRDKEVVEAAVKSLPEEFATIDILVNNAGNAHGMDPIQTGDLSDWDAMIDINVKGLLYVSRAILPGMVANSIAIGSKAYSIGFYPKFNRQIGCCLWFNKSGIVYTIC